MKKTNLLVLSVAAAMLATSCSKDQVSEVNPGKEIRLKSFAGATTKASEITTGLMADFKVYAFTGNTNDGFNAFFDDIYVKNGEGATFVPDGGGNHYWPSNPDQNCVFMGFSPADLSTGIFAQAPTVTVTDPQAATIAGIKQLQRAEEQEDLLVFRNHGTETDNGTSGVNLYMQHAMSQILVQAVNYDPSTTIKVKAVKIFAKGTGTLTLPAQSIMTSAPIALDRWAADGTYNTYITGGKGGETPTADVVVSTVTATPSDLTFSEGGFMLMPQVLTPWTEGTDADGAYIAVLCNISQNGTQLYPSVQDSYGYAGVPIDTTWEPGKKYTYTLQFFKDGGGAGVTPPTDPTEPPVEPTPDPGTPGEPVLGGTISFNVEVNTWQPTNNGNAYERPMK